MDNITKIINEWDPIDFFPYAPEDEYEEEIKKISNYLNNIDVDKISLTKKINEVFIQAFGEDIYGGKIEESEIIADKIIDSIRYNNRI